MIDSLVVSLGLDATKFAAGQKQASASLAKMKQDATDTGKAVDAHSNRIVSFFDMLDAPARTLHGHFHALASQAGRMGESVQGGAKAGQAALVAMGAAGLAVFATLKAIKGLTDMAIRDAPATANTARQARNIGIPTRTLSTWEIAANEAVGAPKEAVAGGMTSLSQDITRLRLGLGMSGSLEALYRTGVNVQQPVDQVLLDFAAKLHGMRPQAALALGRQAGLDDAFINFLERGPEAIRAALAKANPAAETNAQAAAAKRLVTATNELAATWAAFEREVATAITPNLIAFDHAIERIIHGIASLLGLEQPTAEQKEQASRIYRSFHTASPADGIMFPGSTPKGGAVPPASAFLAARQDRVIAEAQAAGMPASAAIGAAANAQREVGPAFDLNSPAMQASAAGANGQPGFGIAQWSPERAARILAGTGIDVKTAPRAEQFRAEAWEMKKYYPDLWAALPKMTPAEAGAAIARVYEQPKETDYEARMRALIAGQIAARRSAPPAVAGAGKPTKVPPPLVIPSLAALRVPTGADVHAAVRTSHTVTHNNDNRRDNSIGAINVSVNAKTADARGIGVATERSIRNALLGAQSNRGLA